jgi:twitching motility protein PilT
MMQAGKKHGMQTLNDALYQLYMAKEVAEDECLRVSSDPNEFLRMIGKTAVDEAPAPAGPPSVTGGAPRR